MFVQFRHALALAARNEGPVPVIGWRDPAWFDVLALEAAAAESRAARSPGGAESGDEGLWSKSAQSWLRSEHSHIIQARKRRKKKKKRKN